MSNLLPKSLFSASTLKREPVEDSVGKGQALRLIDMYQALTLSE